MPSTTATTPAATSTIDPASRIDPREHNPRVAEMVNTPMSLGVLEYFLEVLVLAVASAMIGPPYKVAFGLRSVRMTNFIHTFIANTRIATPAILVALVYIDRIKAELVIDREDWVCERLAIGALITAQKYIIDAGTKADFWASCANLPKADVNRIEREFLALLDFDMRVTDADLLAHYDGFLRAARADAEHERRDAQRAAGTSIFARRERAEYHYHIQDREERCRSSPPEPLQLPDLMYPDTPESNDTPPIVTPPDVPGLRPSQAQYAWPASTLVTAPTKNPYLAAGNAAASSAPTSASHPAPRQDIETEARVRWYAADIRRTHARPSTSPRYQPYSPPSTRYAMPSPPGLSRRRPSRQQKYPWRGYQWSSGRDDVWGPSGLFKI